jgi:pyruvate/2-oxoglutarate dehydrogenase complex dihydrolipoamide dehydrogenase (E3) component
MAAATSFTVVGSGVVGTELSHDIKSFFPDKPVNVVTRSDVGFLPRVPGAHELVAKHAEEAGVTLTKGKVIKKTDEDGRLVSMDGELIGEKGARTCD